MVKPAPGEDDKSDPVEVPPEYVDRARKLLDVLYAMRVPWGAEAASPAESSALALRLPPQVQAELAPRFSAPPGLAHFPATQPTPAVVPPRDSRRRQIVGDSGGGVAARAVRQRLAVSCVPLAGAVEPPAAAVSGGVALATEASEPAGGVELPVTPKVCRARIGGGRGEGEISGGRDPFRAQ